MIRKLVNYIGIAAFVVGMSGCAKDALNANASGELDYSKMQPIALSSISTTISSEQGAETKATTNTTPLAVGKTFRLYAFPKGVTDIDKLITTRTYTISSVAGEPVLDPNQENLFLPIGDIDIFLVGPVRHDLNEGKIDANNNPLPPDWVDVATPYGVEPRFGADLVSSKTELNIKVGANQFQAEPLVHRMALMEVVVKRPTDATYTDLKVNAISVMNQTLTGVFEFNATGGAITPADEGTITLSPVIRATIPNEEFRGTMYVIPRKSTQLRIGVFLTCKISGAEVDRRMESGIMTEPLVAGQMNRFITKPYLSDKLIFRLRLLPWDDVSAEDIEVPALGGVLFDYSGLDAPRMIDGKMCVPDRSGNNRHGELVGDIRYNAEEKYYYAAANGAYIKVPDLGKVPVYTLEITAASKRDARSRIAQFNGETSTMSAYLPYTTNTIWYYAGNDNADHFSATSFGNDLNFLEHLAVYAFTCDANKKLTIRRNGVTLATKTGVNPNQQMTDNRLLSWHDDATKGTEIKMYAARMTTKVDDAAIKNNYRNDIANFVGVTVDKDYTKRDYIEDGLILDLRGTNTFIFVDMHKRWAWSDASKTKNHALAMSVNVPQKGTNFYTFNGTQYMQLLHTLGTLQNFTVEVVAKLSSNNLQNTLLNFGHKPEGGDGSRQFSLHFPYEGIRCYSPYSSLLSLFNDDLSYTYTYMKSQPSQWSFARYNDGGKSFLESWLNGGFVKSNSKDEILLKEMRYCFIGFNGTAGTSQEYYSSDVYAIRVYNRVLTELERQHNYQTDKVKYNLVP